MKPHNYKIAVTPLTPVHIGDGSQLEAYEYTIKDGTYFKIDFPRLLGRLSERERQELTAALGRDPIAFRNLVTEAVQPEDAEYTAVASPALQGLAEDKLSDPRNQLLLHPFIRSLGTPFIPGSSIKGAIRTALLFCLLEKGLAKKELGPVDRRARATDLEAQLLVSMGKQGRIDVGCDPLKGLRVSDVPFSAKDIVAEKVGSYQLDEQGLEPMSLQSLHELTVCVTRVEEERTPWWGEIRLYPEWLYGSENSPCLNPPGTAAFAGADLSGVAEACNHFYLERLMEQERKRLAGTEAGTTYDWLQDYCRDVPDQQGFLLRLGWGSGLDSVSLNLVTKLQRPPKTRKLIEGWLPLGWVLIWWYEEETDGDALSN